MKKLGYAGVLALGILLGIAALRYMQARAAAITTSQVEAPGP